MAKSSVKKIVLDADEFDPKYVRVAISIKIPGLVLDALKKEAEAKGTKYQTLINEILREHAEWESSAESRDYRRLISNLEEAKKVIGRFVAGKRKRA